MLSFGWGTKTRKQSLPEGLVEESVKGSVAELQTMIDAEWKKAKRIAIGWGLLGLFFVVLAWGHINKPILDLKDMEINEGILVEAVPERGREFAKIVLRRSDGSLFSVIPYGGTKAFEKRIGQKFKVWSQSTCYILDYICTQSMMQLQYKGQIALDYEKSIRPKAEEFHNGNLKYLFYGFPMFFFLLAIGTLEGIGRKINKLKRFSKEAD